MKQRRLHFMGIGGQGISAVAQMALQAGDIVTGCDRQRSATVRQLEEVGIEIQQGHSPAHLDAVDMLVISPAITALNPHNEELVAAHERNLPIITWQELLSEYMREKCVLSVSGVHGKGSTTAMLSLILVDAGFDPTCEIGAVVPRFGANYRLGQSPYFVNEADEFNHNFWHYHPRVALVKALEYEHPEFFADYDAFLAAFEHFIRGMDMQGDWPIPPTLVLNADSAGCLDLYARLQDWPGRLVTYSVEGLHPAGLPVLEAAETYTASAIQLAGRTSFRVAGRVDTALNGREIHLQLPGIHNIENALAALTVARLLGTDPDALVRTLEGFTGIRRRLEIRHQGPLNLKTHVVDDVMLMDDYAHHPTAISMTLDALRQRYPERRLVAVYQPHMYSRTKTFFAQFVEAFDKADIAIIAEIFPAREQDTGLVHARDLVRALAQREHFAAAGGQIFYGGETLQETVQLLRDQVRSGDLVVMMGAGDVYTVTELLLQGRS
ncbi:MAG TPA: UDP-N-acetylmuramate--L-alanine ligase [Ktedonobacteraceae bacterium]|nr:UDP-N-acetylmuramate--L-alanine ligase [Ktedonobacteraceae bacterium]